MEFLSKRTVFYCYEKEVIDAIRSIPATEFYITSHGRVVDFSEFVSSNSHDFFNFHIRCVGGKGGFSSLLRSFRVNKSTNTDMCRDLNGRRLGAVEKEKKIRKWIENQAEREKMVEEQRNQKIAKLKSKPVHEYKDSETYESKRKEIEEKTDTAFDDGINRFLKNKKEKKSTEEQESETDDSSDEDADMPGTSGFSFRKRRTADLGETSNEEVEAKREKFDEEEESRAEVTNAPESEIANIEVEKQVEEKEHVETTNTTEPVISEPQIPKEIKEFPPLDLDTINSAVELEKFGLEHLKCELEARSLKCGGTLSDRADRLFSIKGLKPDDYPHKIRAASKKGKK